MRTPRSRRIATLFGISAVAVLALPVRAMPPPLVYIEATILTVENTETIEVGVDRLRGRQRPSEQQAQDGVIGLAAVNAGLSQIVTDIGNDAEVGTTSQGTTAQSIFNAAIAMNADASDLFQDRARISRIRPLLRRSHYTQIAGAAALHGQDQRFSDNANTRVRQVRRNYATFERRVDSYGGAITGFDPVDYFEPLDGLRRGDFLTSAGLQTGGDLDVRLNGRGNKYLEFRGRTDESASGFVTLPAAMGDAFTVAVDLGINGRSRRALRRAAGLTMVLEIDRPSDGAFWFIGFQFGENGIQQAFTADSGGVLDTVQITDTDTQRSHVLAFATLEDETLVLGGLFREKGRNGGTRPVFLGDIPVVGNLFKAGTGAQGATRGRRGRADDLMVFITPRIIPDE